MSEEKEDESLFIPPPLDDTGLDEIQPLPITNENSLTGSPTHNNNNNDEFYEYTNIENNNYYNFNEYNTTYIQQNPELYYPYYYNTYTNTQNAYYYPTTNYYNPYNNEINNYYTSLIDNYIGKISCNVIQTKSNEKELWSPEDEATYTSNQELMKVSQLYKTQNKNIIENNKENKNESKKENNKKNKKIKKSRSINEKNDYYRQMADRLSNNNNNNDNNIKSKKYEIIDITTNNDGFNGFNTNIVGNKRYYNGLIAGNTYETFENTVKGFAQIYAIPDELRPRPRKKHKINNNNNNNNNNDNNDNSNKNNNNNNSKSLENSSETDIVNCKQIDVKKIMNLHYSDS